MPLNPIQFGKDVIDQYGRYLLTTFRLADPDLLAQLRRALAYEPGTAERLAKGPYVYLNRPFVQGPGIRELVGCGNLERKRKRRRARYRGWLRSQNGNPTLIALQLTIEPDRGEPKPRRSGLVPN